MSMTVNESPLLVALTHLWESFDGVARAQDWKTFLRSQCPDHAGWQATIEDAIEHAYVTLTEDEYVCINRKGIDHVYKG